MALIPFFLGTFIETWASRLRVFLTIVLTRTDAFQDTRRKRKASLSLYLSTRICFEVFGINFEKSFAWTWLYDVIPRLVAFSSAHNLSIDLTQPTYAKAMMFTFRSYLIFLGVLFLNLSPGAALAIDVVHDPISGFEPGSLALPVTGETANTPGSIDTASNLAPVALKPRDDGTLYFHVDAGQPFFFWVLNFLFSNINYVEIQTSPAVSWISLDLTKRAITGWVPFDFPLDRVQVDLTVWYITGWRVASTKVCVILEIHRPAGISTPWPASSSTSRSTGSITALPRSSTKPAATSSRYTESTPSTSLSVSTFITTTTSFPSTSDSSSTIRPTWSGAFLNTSIPNF